MTGSLKGEGEMIFVVKERCRRACDNCGEPATKCHNYCYVNGRSNPASSMYGRDDCTCCSDHQAFACDECEREVRRVCCPDGMDWGSTFSAPSGFDHMFLHWVEREVSAPELAALIDAQAVRS